MSCPGAAHAQTVEDDTIEQITVTARKRDESLLDVPISITAVTERRHGSQWPALDRGHRTDGARPEREF